VKPNKLQPYQAYWQLYQESKLKIIVDTRYNDHVKNTLKEKQETWIGFTTKVVKELFEAESAEVKEEVEEYREKQVTSGVIKLEDDEDAGKAMDGDAQQVMNDKMQS
jgi:zona occludens toxin (predicted ATPase)